MGVKVVATNRKARHEYFLLETYEAGIVLQGSEIKSIRAGQVSLAEAFVRIDGQEAWLEDAHIAPYADSATWMTGNGLLRGKDAIRASLVKSFQREGKLVGDLRFSDTEFHALDANAVMTTGAFHLTNLPSGREINGRSTLIWVRRGSKWLILHDHSS